MIIRTENIHFMHLHHSLNLLIHNFITNIFVHLYAVEIDSFLPYSKFISFIQFVALLIIIQINSNDE